MAGKEGRKKATVNKWADILKAHISLLLPTSFGYRILWDFCELGVDRVSCVSKEMIPMAAGCSTFGIHLLHVVLRIWITANWVAREDKSVSWRVRQEVASQPFSGKARLETHSDIRRVETPCSGFQAG